MANPTLRGGTFRSGPSSPLTGGTSTVVRVGAGVPSDATGADGDLWVDSDNGDYYRRESGAYALVGTMAGPAGPQGATGPRGLPGSGAGTPPLVVGLYDRVVTDAPYNAVADHGVTDNSAAIQAAIDDVAADLASVQNFAGKGRVIVPASAQGFGLRRPVYLDADSVELVGVDESSLLLVMAPIAGVVVSERRSIPVNQNGTVVHYTPSLGNRVDAYGVLDSGAAPASGQRWGFRSLGTHYVRFVATPPQCGVKSSGAYGQQSDNWSETAQLTAEWCMTCPGGALTARAPVMGLGGGDPYVTCPWLIEASDTDDHIDVVFRTSDVFDGETGDRTYYRSGRFAAGSGSGPRRIAVQIDLVNRTLVAFVNGVQVAVSALQNLGPSDPYPWTVATTFAVNDDQPFMLGSNGVGAVTGSTGVDAAYYGLRVSDTLRYRQNGVGTPQVMVGSGAPPTDLQAYFSDDANTVFYLPFTDPPSASSRLVSCAHGAATWGGTSFGTLENAVDMPGTTHNAVRNLRITSETPYGCGVLKGPGLGFTMQGVTIDGGHAGYLVNPRFANYYDEILDCRLSGNDCAVSLWNTLCRIERLDVPVSGRVTIRSHCSAIDLRFMFVEQGSAVSQNIIKAVGSGYGGGFTVVGVEVDYEGNALAGVLPAGFYFEACGDVPLTAVTLQDCFLGTLGAAACAVRLRDRALPTSPNYGPALLVLIDPLFTDANCDAVIEVDGPRWRADVNNAMALKGKAVVKHTGRWGSACNVVVHDRELNAVPTSGRWVAGAHFIHKSTPAPGDPTGWVCVQSGDFATPTHPRFAPVGVVGAMI